MKVISITILLLLFYNINALPSKPLTINGKDEYDEEDVKEKLAEYEIEASHKCNIRSLASWAMETNIGDLELVNKYQTAVADYANFRKEQYDMYFKTVVEYMRNGEYSSLKRQLQTFVNMGISVLDQTQLDELTAAQSEMKAIYSSAKICPYGESSCVDQSWSLDNEIQSRMSKSRDYDELEYIFNEWHEQSGKKMIPYYKDYVTLMNNAAVKNGFNDAGEMWVSAYEYDTPLAFKTNVDELWSQVEPLYELLHRYVKIKLSKLYPDKVNKNDETIPAHILGNMWAQTWEDLYEDLKPYKNAGSINVDAKMLENYDVKQMFETADEFYTSMGLETNKISYTVPPAMIEKPLDKTVACHASAWDFCDESDFRIKMCTHVDMHDFLVVHHEMGHIQYFLQYKNQPLSLRGGANPGFHEAVGDTIALSVDTAKHLKKIGLLDNNYVDSKESQINALFATALKRVAFLPFGLLIDKWRWEVFSNDIKQDEWNKRWWELRKEYQKVAPPSKRDSDDYFDPGAKYHIPNDSQYIAYFIAHILEFQMYRALCIEAGEYDPAVPDAPLHNCDFYESKEAGAKLAAGLSLGTSKHWSEALFAITGETDISSGAILEYFEPLMQYMQNFLDVFDEETEIWEKLEHYNLELKDKCNIRTQANWNVQTDVGNEDLVNIYQEAVFDYAYFRNQQYTIYFKEKIQNMKAGHYSDVGLVRQLQLLDNMGTSLLDENGLNHLTSSRAEMSAIYNSAKICPYDDKLCVTKTWSLDNEIQSRMSKSRDYDELEYIFNEWHEQSGKKMIPYYKDYVTLMNNAAVKNGFNDAGEMWVSAYEYDTPLTFKTKVDELWSQVEPLYVELHKYVKYKLSKLYPDKVNKNDETIPAHILGNMWAQTWEDLYEDLKPYKNAGSINVDAKMLENYDVKQMFETADEFYTSMGLESNKISYTVPPAMIEKPLDKTVACHASAWDFCDESDFRIKMCTHVDMHDFLVVHHEMGHIQYYLQYKNQPLSLRGGANPGFHEAVGDTIALSVDTAKHLKKIGLLDNNYVDSKESQINALFATALKRVAFLPFGLLIDKWRWEVFSNDIKEDEWNKRWWELRKEYQKVAPPSNRDSDEYFDPGAKYHIPNDSQYIAYFIAHILEFQMYRALCIEAGEYDPAVPDAPLHNCDFYESKEAGAKLAAGLSLGTSKHWSEALFAITGETDISSGAILEYFEPLMNYMKKYNEAIEALETYNQLAPHECNKIVTAEWEVNIDVENEVKQNTLSRATVAYSQFLQEQAFLFKDVKLDDFDDELEQRQVREIKNLGTAILVNDDLEILQKTISEMERIYNTATICKYGDNECDTKWSLDPEMEAIMAESTNYDELEYVWKEWRKNSGKLMRGNYKKYVELSNKAAIANGYNDYGEMWRDTYEDDKFDENIELMWNQVKELYNELHTYVLRKLKKLYGSRLADYETTIPAHILGNMWAQSWVHLYERIKPFNNGSLIDVTEAIKTKYTIKEMFKESDKFYSDLGLESMAMSYDENVALISKPENTKVACHASAWDFCNGEDFRIKMCTNLNMEDFVTIHHEMGHIQYYLLYKDLPIALRGGANPGFHEAVGDLIALSVSTPKHLQKLQLLEDYEDSYENDINSLFKMALERVAFLPFGLLIDKWRWDVFSGEVAENEWNSHWWKLREQYQKVVSPVERTEQDFDPGAKYHIPADSKYISYFIAHILEFQLHRAVCIEADEYDPDDATKPLHKCDIDKSLEAGTKLRNGLSLGFSKHWSESLKAMTDETDISGIALMEYFAPLLKFLKEQNALEEDDNDDDDDAGVIVGGDKGIVISVALLFYGLFSWIRSYAL